MRKPILFFFLGICLYFVFVNFGDFLTTEIWYPQKERYELFEKEFGINIPNDAIINEITLYNSDGVDDLSLVMVMKIPIAKEEEFINNIKYELIGFPRFYDEKNSFSISSKNDNNIQITFNFYKPEGITRKISINKSVDYTYQDSGQGISQEILDWMPRFIPIGIDRWGLKY